MKTVLLFILASATSALCQSSGLDAHATPSPTPYPTMTFTKSDVVDMTSLTTYSCPRDYTIYESGLTFHCFKEPVVKKEKDGKWMITFKP